MNKQIKELWCSNLRSGRFKQATRALTKLDSEGNVVGHCCLGVLTELAVEAGVQKAGIPAGMGETPPYLGYESKILSGV